MDDPTIAKAVLMIRAYRWFLAFLALAVRYVYAYYSGHNMLEPNSWNAVYFLWSVIFAFAVYMVALPPRRTQNKHPSQRRSDRERTDDANRHAAERTNQIQHNEAKT